MHVSIVKTNKNPPSFLCEFTTKTMGDVCSILLSSYVTHACREILPQQIGNRNHVKPHFVQTFKNDNGCFVCIVVDIVHQNNVSI